jgi:hypothetical protein
MILWDVDPDVESFFVESIKSFYVMPSGRRSHYTTDRLVHYRGGRRSLLVEIKPRRNLRKQRAIWAAKFAVARAEAQRRDWIFEVWTEKTIHGPQLDNASFLRGFLPHPPDSDLQNRLLMKLAALGSTTVDYLLSCVATDAMDRAHLIPQIWQLIALRKIASNWKNRITLDSKIEPSVQDGNALQK